MKFPSALLGILSLIVIVGFLTSHLPGVPNQIYYTPLNSSVIGVPEYGTNEEESQIWDSWVGNYFRLLASILFTVFNSLMIFFISMHGGLLAVGLLPEEFSIIYTLVIIAILFGIIKLVWQGIGGSKS